MMGGDDDEAHVGSSDRTVGARPTTNGFGNTGLQDGEGMGRWTECRWMFRRTFQ